MAEREVSMMMIIGAPGTGKTFDALRVLKALGRNRALVLDPGGMEKSWWHIPVIPPTADAIRNFKGVKRIEEVDMENSKEVFSLIFKNYRNGLLILDDCKVYSDSMGPPALKNILRRKRQMMLDVVAITHGFTDVPPYYYLYTTEFLLHLTLDEIAQRKDVIPGYLKFLEHRNSVNRHAQKDKHYAVLIKRTELLS